MSSESQREPFLGGYADRDFDDEDSTKEEARRYRNVQRTGRNYLPYLILCIATSFFWAGLFTLFHPSEGGECYNSSPATATATTTAAAATTTNPADANDSNNTPSRPLNMTSNAHLLHCGTTPSEARLRNCKYDILLNNWVPSPCFTQEFIDDYIDENNYSATNGWGGYADEHLTQPLSLQQMSEGPFYWTSLRDHVTHCAVMWKKQFATMFEYEGKGVVDTVLASAGHTDHCAQFLMDFGTKNWTGATKTEMGFAGCWVRDGQ